MGPKADKKATSNARHWCEYCRTFVYNNKISRDKHDTSDWHRQSVERFIARQQRDDQQRKRLLGQFTAATGVRLGQEQLARSEESQKTSFYDAAGLGLGRGKEETIDLLTMSTNPTTGKRTTSAWDLPPPVLSLEQLQAQTATVGAWQEDKGEEMIKSKGTKPMVEKKGTTSLIGSEGKKHNGEEGQQPRKKISISLKPTSLGSKPA